MTRLSYRLLLALVFNVLLLLSVSVCEVSANPEGEEAGTPTSAAAAGVASRLASRVPVAPSSSSEQDVSASEATTVQTAADAAEAAMNDYIVQVVNALPGAGWTAGINEYFKDKSLDFVKQSCGLKLDQALMSSASSVESTSSESPALGFGGVPLQASSPVPNAAPVTAAASDIPAFFDSRRQWGAGCLSLFDIRDQAGCGSCWAVASASVMTDRHCIHSNGARRPYLSAKNILTCCGAQCGSCEGGYPLHAFQMWQNEGIVTGGDYGTTASCQPYFLAPCDHHTESGLRPKCTAHTTTPACSRTCSASTGLALSMDYSTDKHFGSSAYAVSSHVPTIQREIMRNGPLTVGFMVYADFPHYKGGVYRHVVGKQLGGHAVKLLGWGTEDGQDYWLCANSWNTNWGLGGFFKIARGTNEGMIEQMVWGGLPRA